MYKQATRVLARQQCRSNVPALQRVATRSLAIPAAQASNHKQSTFPRMALIGAVAVGSTVAVLSLNNTAQAEEKPTPIFSAKDVEVFAVIGAFSLSLLDLQTMSDICSTGPPLSGKGTMCQRMARRFE